MKRTRLVNVTSRRQREEQIIPTRIMVGLIVPVMLTMAGCTATTRNSPTSSASSAIAAETGSIPSSAAPLAYGQDARQLASEIPGCSSSALLDEHAVLSLAPALTTVLSSLTAAASTTSCTLRGSGILLMRFTDNATQQRALTALKGVETNLADGRGWVAVPTSTAEPAQGLSAVQAVAQSLGGDLVAGK